MGENGTETDNNEIIEGRVVDESTEVSTALATRQATPGAALFRTDDPVEVIEQAGKVANALADVIRQKDLATRIQGKDHVRVEGWQLLGVMLGVTAVCVHTETVDGGYKATVEARTADGRVIGRADALCTKHEKRGPWKSADDYARLSMAQTRATSKALKGPLGFVVSLAGYQTTPAEEMTFTEPDRPASETETEVEFVTAEDIEALQAAAEGLKGPQIKLAMGAAGVPIPDPFVWNRVPRDKAAALAQSLSEIERPS